jgi:hypothetical protein
MGDLQELDRLMNERLGEGTNKFKRGIVYDKSEEFGDKVMITIIANGFEMTRLEEIADVKLGSIISIESDYVYQKSTTEHMPESTRTSNKIGYTASQGRWKMSFSDKPALLIGDGESRSEMENEPAIRRKSGTFRNE